LTSSSTSSRIFKNYTLEEIKDYTNTFGMELALIQPLGHDHIVRLVGSCAEGEERILVYGHMDNGGGGAASA
jgi:hypothetical protein